MSEGLKPGLYRATFATGEERVIKVVDPDAARDGCTVHTPEGKCVCHGMGHITDARPLIVIDLSGFISDAALVADLRRGGWGFNEIADQIEAQTKPARIPEPGQGARVEASLLGFNPRNEYLHIGTLDHEHWVRIKDGNVYAWDLLTNPELAWTNSE
jgi:hypothetical protein